MTSHRALARNRDFTGSGSARPSASSAPAQPLRLPAGHLRDDRIGAAGGVAVAAYPLGLAVTLLPAGVLADRVDRRRLMRCASGGGVLLYGSLVGAGIAGTLTVPHLLVVALLTGAAAGLFAPAEISAVRSVVTTEQLPTALAQNQARHHVAGLLGAPIGGLLYTVARWLPFAADAVTFAFSWVLLGRIRTDLSAPPRSVDRPRRKVRHDLAIGFAFIGKRPLFRVLTIWSALANLAINALFFVAVLRMIEAGIPAFQIGLVEPAAGAFGILGAIAAPALIERVPTGRLTVAVAWSFVPLIVPLALWNEPAVVAAALSIGLFLNPAGNAGIGAYRIAVTPADLQGRVQSTMQFVSMSTMPLAPVLAGVLLSALGGGLAIVALGLVTAGVALIPTLSYAVRSVPRPDDWPRLEGLERDPVAA